MATDYTTPAARYVASLATSQVAHHGRGSTDNAEARAFFDSLRDSLAAAIEWADGSRPGENALAEICDDAPSPYNWTRMMEAIGTGAYLRTSDLATGDEDMVTLAGYVLYELARDIVEALLDEAGLGD